MLYLGNEQPKELYVGSTPVKALYMGNQLVWQKKPDNIMVLTVWSWIEQTYFQVQVQVSGTLTHAQLDEYYYIHKANIPPSITQIGDSCFSSNLGGGVTLPPTLKRIGDFAFYGCGLQSIQLPVGLQQIGLRPFGYCSLLSRLTVAQGNPVYYDGGCNCIINRNTKQLQIGVTGDRNCKIPSEVTSIKAQAFTGADNLESVTVPSSVKTIGNRAFAQCDRLWVIYCGFSEGAVSGAPWGAPSGTKIYYDWSEEQAALLAATPLTLDLEEECSHPNLNERCYCPDCKRYFHKLDEHCKCKCGYTQHDYQLDGDTITCTKCGETQPRGEQNG